jgi:eukaryotic-like serine/threonine-protein kinase
MKIEALTKAGRYEITGEIGRGAMGVVYRAVDPVIGRPVAVKSLQLSEAGTGLTRAELLLRFQTEARAAGLLTHPNIVVVYDAGEEDGLFFITMELVEGKSLQALLDAGQMFPLPRILRIMEQTCGALGFAHERNIVHRDIKPANLMLTPDDTVKVTDFGTAKILQFGTVQQTAHVMGTPSYMSPEQVKGKIVDGRSDIFSLGVLLYEMVTGEKPFPGQNITTVIYKIVNEEPVAPRQLDPSIHPGLNAVILKALAKEPAERYQNCRDLMEDLRNYRSLAVPDSPNATLPLRALHPSATPNFQQAPQILAASRSLNGRLWPPGETPRLGGSNLGQGKKDNRLVTVLAALFLLGVIVFGAQKIRPVFEQAREQNRASAGETLAGPVAIDAGKAPTAGAAAELVPPSPPAPEPVAPERSRNSGKPVASSPKAAAPDGLSPAAAAYKARIEEAAAVRHLDSRLSIQGTGNTLTLSGKLRPDEHSDLLKSLRNAPAGVQVVDDIQYEGGPGKRDHEGHPAAVPGRAAVHVLTNTVGAVASLGTHAGSGRRCETPCSFSGLEPGTYNLAVQKPGFQPVETALQLHAGESVDERLQLEPLSQGLFISSQPAGADVFINGDKQAGQTPVTLPLAPGKYNLVLRIAGYDAYSSQVEVQGDGQARVEAELRQKNGHVAWAQITSSPGGAEIWIDGVATGQRTPARVEIPSGIHNVVLRLDGYQLARRAVQTSEGGTVTVSQVLSRK